MELYSDAEFKWFGLASENIDKTLCPELRRHSLWMNLKSERARVLKNRQNEQMVQYV